MALRTYAAYFFPLFYYIKLPENHVAVAGGYRVLAMWGHITLISAVTENGSGSTLVVAVLPIGVYSLTESENPPRKAERQEPNYPEQHSQTDRAVPDPNCPRNEDENEYKQLEQPCDRGVYDRTQQAKFDEQQRMLLSPLGLATETVTCPPFLVQS